MGKMVYTKLMDSEKQFFLQLINSAINSKEVTVSGDSALAFKVATGQKLEYLIYYALKNGGFAEFDKDVKKRIFDKIVKNELFFSDVKKFFSVFEKNRIKCVPIKGYNVRKLYPVPEMRDMNDLDVLIFKKDAKKVKRLLKKAGFSYYKSTLKHVEFHSPNGFLFEVHVDLYGRFLPESFVNEVLSDNNIIHSPTAEQEYIICLAHLASHYLSGGVGIRNIIDLYLLNRLPLNRDFVSERLNKYNLSQFERKMGILAEVIFNGRVPDEFSLILLDECFTSFALGSLDKKELYLLAQRYDGDYNKAKKVGVLRKIYPSFSDMKGVYPVLSKCPILLPFCHFIRHVKLLFRGKKRVKSFSEQEVVKAKEILSGLGLTKF